jgi:alpha-tubulin suppressor-like RCC1 family protein
MGDNLPYVDVGVGGAVVAISAGSEHTCVLIDWGVCVKCWGANNVGQLGIGDTKDRGTR